MLKAWVPGLRRARVVATAPDGLPAEIYFELAATLTYSLAYTHDLERREVRWEPRVGRRDGVRGFARFDPEDDGTRITYGLEEGDGRTAADRAIADPQALLAAFSRWMQDEPDVR